MTDIKEEEYSVSITRDAQTGQRLTQVWRRNGKFENPDGPAVSRYARENGALTYEAYWRNGDFHREDGPAIVDYDPTTGVVIGETYMQNGKMHNPNGPASVDRGSNGKVLKYEYWIDGKRVEPFKPRGSTPKPA